MIWAFSHSSGLLSRDKILNVARTHPPFEHFDPLTVYQFLYQFGRKKTGFLQLVKNNLRSEKTQKPKKRGVIANPSSSLIYRKTRSPFFKTGGVSSRAPNYPAANSGQLIQLFQAWLLEG
jgi:hypothetical protein